MKYINTHMDFYIKIELKNKLEQCKRMIMMSQKKKKRNNQIKSREISKTDKRKQTLFSMKLAKSVSRLDFVKNK